MTSTSKPGFRGPRRTLIGGTLAVLVGVTAAVASFVMVQAQGVSGVAMDVGGPIANTVLAAVGEPKIDAAGGDGGSSTLLLVVFLIGALLTALGAFLLLTGTLWMLVRGMRHTHAAATPVVTRATRDGRARIGRLRGAAPARTEPALPPGGMNVASGGLTAGDPLEPGETPAATGWASDQARPRLPGS